MHDEDRSRRVGWGAGWSDAINKLRVILDKEIADVESRLVVAREDFSEEHPAVLYLDDHRLSLRRIAYDMDIILPGMWGKVE